MLVTRASTPLTPKPTATIKIPTTHPLYFFEERPPQTPSSTTARRASLPADAETPLAPMGGVEYQRAVLLRESKLQSCQRPYVKIFLYNALCLIVLTAAMRLSPLMKWSDLKIQKPRDFAVMIITPLLFLILILQSFIGFFMLRREMLSAWRPLSQLRHSILAQTGCGVKTRDYLKALEPFSKKDDVDVLVDGRFQFSMFDIISQEVLSPDLTETIYVLVSMQTRPSGEPFYFFSPYAGKDLFKCTTKPDAVILNGTPVQLIQLKDDARDFRTRKLIATTPIDSMAAMDTEHAYLVTPSLLKSILEGL